MRLTRERAQTWTARGCAAFVLLCALAAGAASARAQNPDTLLPEQSAAKAKALIQQAIAALGGEVYLNVKDANCSARLSFFGHSGDLTGYDFIRDYSKFPDKNRTEYSKKGNIVNVFNGDQGWTLDKGGVQEATMVDVERFQEDQKKDLDNLLRSRLKEEGMNFRYGGSDIVDLKQVDWVEIVDHDRRTIRVALDKETHLPVRSTVTTRDPATRERTEETTYYSNYHAEQGIQTPFQIERDRNGIKVFQAFYYGCTYNTDLSDDLFTRASLEKRFAEVGKKGKKR